MRQVAEQSGEVDEGVKKFSRYAYPAMSKTQVWFSESTVINALCGASDIATPASAAAAPLLWTDRLKCSLQLGWRHTVSQKRLIWAPDATTKGYVMMCARFLLHKPLMQVCCINQDAHPQLPLAHAGH